MPGGGYFASWFNCFRGGLFNTSSNLRRTILGTSLQMMQQMTGINFIFYVSQMKRSQRPEENFADIVIVWNHILPGAADYQQSILDRPHHYSCQCVQHPGLILRH